MDRIPTKLAPPQVLAKLFFCQVMTDLARIGRILSSLPADDASFLSGLIEPLFKQRDRRLTQRDDAIRRALDLLAGTTNPSARLAKQMALQEREHRPERLTGDHLLVEAVSEILQLNGGKAITARHIANIAAGTRSPWKLSAVEISTAKRA